MFKYPSDTNFKNYKIMSLSVGAGMAIAGGIAAASSAGNAIAQGKLNKKNRQWQEKMYERRLADQRADWQMNNEYNEEMYNKYNSPTAQVRQMQAAGVNPDLNGVDGSSLGASSSPAGAPDAGSAPYQMGNVDPIGQFAQIMSMYQQIQSASLDNQMKVQQIKSMAKDDVLNHLVNLYNPKQDLTPIPTDVDGLGTGKNGTIEALTASESRGDGTRYYRNLGYDKRSARIAYAMQKQFNKEDVRSAYYGKKLSTEQGRKDLFNIVGSSMFSDNDESMTENFKSYNDAIEHVQELARKAQEARAKYDADYYNNLNGADMATSAQNSASSDAKIKAQTASKGENADKINEHFEEYISKYEKGGDNRAWREFSGMILRMLWKRYGDLNFLPGA